MKVDSAEPKGPRQLLRIRSGIFEFEPGLGLKLDQTKPERSGTEPEQRDTRIPNDYGPTSACFDDNPKLLNCEIAQNEKITGESIFVFLSRPICGHSNGKTYCFSFGVEFQVNFK